MTEPTAARPSPVSPVLLENPFTKPGNSVDAQNLLAARASVLAARGGEAVSAAFGPSPGITQLSGPRFVGTPADAAPDSGSARTEPDGSLLPAPALLASVPPLDLSALERGLQQFLEQLESAGQDLVEYWEGAGLGPWIVAGAAALTACEIARRQIQRSDVRGQKSDKQFLVTSDL